MDIESDTRLALSQDLTLSHDLARSQWEALKALRATAAELRRVHRAALEVLIALDLAAMRDGLPVLTPKGRTVLVRGSPELWDLAA